MPEPIDLPAARRAQLDQALSEAVDGLLAQAAERDHLDVIEANADLTDWLSAHLTYRELAKVAAALAIRLHRGDDTRFDRCTQCGNDVQWVPAQGPFAGRWCHLDPRKPYHRPEVES